MSEQNFVGQIDEAIGTFFAQWNVGSTIIVGILLFVLIYPLFTAKDPDTHPFLLARQAQAAPIRHQGESAVYRSTEIPYGYPLRSGLAIKDPGASKWTTGRDGDLRDVWRQAVNGVKKEDGTPAGSSAKISTVLGVEKVIEHDLKGLTLDINVLGKHIKDVGGRKVAVCLSNSAELLCTVFAGSFYHFSPILFPFLQQPAAMTSLLNTTDFDTLIAEAGCVALEKLLAKNKSVKRIIWVAKEGSKHIDWTEVPEGFGGKVDVTTWDELIEEKKQGVSNEVPPLDRDTEASSIFAFWPNKAGEYQLIEYTQKTLMAGTAALQASFPRLHKLNSTSTILLTAPLTQTYTLSFALLTLFTNSTLLLTSVAGPSISILNATKSARDRLKPTHIVADCRAIPRFIDDVTALAAKGGLGAKYGAWKTGRQIGQGYMDVDVSKPGYLPTGLIALRALFIVQPDTVKPEERVPSQMLAQLRLLLSARVSLALTTGRVAGPVTQSNLLDYRDKGVLCCVGPVASSLELCLLGPEEEMSKVDGVGQIAIKGPSVVGAVGRERVAVEGAVGMVDVDNTVVLTLSRT